MPITLIKHGTVVTAQRTFAADILIDYYHGIQTGLAPLAGQLGATYAIPIVYVPLLMITHGVAFYLLLRSARGNLAGAQQPDRLVA